MALSHNQVVHSPDEEYRRRLAARREEHAAWNRRDAQLAYSRLAIFAVFIALALLAATRGLPAFWLLLPVAAFVVLVRQHDRVIRQRDATAKAIVFYERGLARLEDRWSGLGEPGDRFRDDHHLYANDLDLFGHGSLFQLLSIAGTAVGEETLAAWLKQPADPQEIAARQQAIVELTPSLDLREALGREGTAVRAGVHSDTLLAWAEGPPLLFPAWLRWVSWLLTAGVVASFVMFFTTGAQGPLVTLLVIQSLFLWPQMPRIEHALHGAEGVMRDLDVLAHLLERLEHEKLSSPRLVRLQEQLRTGQVDASQAIHALRRRVEIAEWQHNLIFLVLSLPFMLGTHVAWAIEAWRGRYGGHIREWLGAAGEFEALASLSAYRYEHPADPFPTLTSDKAARFEGTSLGHPLIPAARMVRNDVQLDATTRLIVVSGSNMSGKSTYLRAVGINAVLAFTGAPVRATQVTLSPLALGATLRIQDSLQEGRSRFYAEITRIRELTDLAAGPLPLLFLLDELFHGTNSHDRLIGASGVLGSLLDRGAIGLITTHDLALTAIADELAPRATNVHFEDWFEGNDMRFDYRAKPGRVTRSNALALMKAVGLEVGS